MHPRKKLEIVVESTLTERVVDVLDRRGAPGYTVFEASSGRGRRGSWKRDQISNAFHRNVVLMVADADLCTAIIEDLRSVIDDYTAVLFLSDVEVLRADHF